MNSEQLKLKNKWKLVEQIWHFRDLCDDCTYKDKVVGEGFQCSLLEGHTGKPEYCPQFEEAIYNPLLD